MAELWLVRHGQTDWNLEQRIQGHTDLPLNGTGMAQARDLGESLAGSSFDALFSSDLQRARQTAAALARRFHLSIHLDQRLRERSLGVWEGLTIPEIKQRYPEFEENRRRDPLNTAPPGGESLLQLAERVTHAAGDITRQFPSGRVLVVSHGLALAALICLAREIPLQEAFKRIPQNASPEVVQWI